MSGVEVDDRGQQIHVTVRTLDGTVTFAVTEQTALELRDGLERLS